eukprot:474935-Prorocentrum_minimum.AAC.1
MTTTYCPSNFYPQRHAGPPARPSGFGSHQVVVVAHQSSRSPMAGGSGSSSLGMTRGAEAVVVRALAWLTNVLMVPKGRKVRVALFHTTSSPSRMHWPSFSVFTTTGLN